MEREQVEPVQPGPDGTYRFRVPTGIMIMKFGGVALLAGLSVLAASGPQRVAALVAAVLLAIYGLRDVVARERLRADHSGLVVIRGYAARQRLDWTDIERIRVDTRSRLGTTTRLLEVDTGDDIHLYSRYDLGVDPDAAVIALDSLRTAS
jgi:hypothetical protein